MAGSPARLSCPRCSSRASGFVLFQFLVREHRVVGLGKAGALRVRREAAREDTGGALPLLRCGSCGHEFDVPRGRRVKFV